MSKKTPPDTEVHTRATFPFPPRAEGNPPESRGASTKSTPKKVSVTRVPNEPPKKAPSLAPGARFYQQSTPSLEASLGVLPTAKKSEELSPDYIPVDLPSGYYFYPFKNLSVSQSLKGIHQAKFNRAAMEGSLSLTAETVSSLLGDGVSAMDLTIPDFNWLLLWLRLNCYGKVQMQYVVTCKNPDHVLKVVEKKLDKSTLENVEIIDRTSIKTTRFDSSLLEGLNGFEVMDTTDFALTYPRISDSVQLSDMQNRPNFSELQYLGDLAACIQLREGPILSLEDRIKLVSDLPMDVINFLERYAFAVSGYGAEETIKTRCRSCSAEIVTEVAISAHLFSREYSV